MAAGALELGTDFNQFAATDRADRTRWFLFSIVGGFCHDSLLGKIATWIVMELGVTVQVQRGKSPPFHFISSPFPATPWA